MYIEPNTTIRVLNNIRFDNTYQHTIYFSDSNTQYTYFNAKTKYSFNNYTYQRVNKTQIKVQQLADNLYDCNYLMFQNTNYGSKWFYAFITSIEYVNNVTSLITYEIDVIQTYLLDFHLLPSFVEREHSLTDEIGENLVDENLELGTYVDDYSNRLYEADDLSIVVATNFYDDSNFSDYYGAVWGGMFSGLNYIVFPYPLGVASLIDFLTRVATANKTDGIINIFLMPTQFISAENSTSPMQWTISISKPINGGQIDGYVPKNNKLYTYPYNFIYVSNLQGNSAVFKYEFFEGNTTALLKTSCDTTTNPNLVLFPLNYKKVSNNYDEKIMLSGFPPLPYSTDYFKSWLAENSINLGLNALSQAVTGSAIVGAVAGPGAIPIGAIVGLVTSIGQSVAQIRNAEITPNQTKGTGSSLTMAIMGMLTYFYSNRNITAEYAEIIDNYFSMFGYATHKVKIPNISSRPHWNYTKTKGCNIYGDMPVEAIKRIKEIFDVGVTFWKNGDNIGDYTLDNKPINGD